MASLGKGISLGIGAGALWGLVFLAPALVQDFSALQLTIGRYLCYGVIATLWLWPHRQTLIAKIRRQEWIALIWLSLTGNTLYYLHSYAPVLLAAAVGSTPLPAVLCRRMAAGRAGRVLDALEPIALLALLAVCTAFLVSGSANPFLYFRF